MRTTILPILLLTAGGCSLHMDWEDEANYTQLTQSEDTGDEQRLRANVDLSVGKLEIQAGSPEKAYSLDLNYNELAFDPRVDFRREGDTAILDFALKGGGRSMNIGKTRLNLSFNPETILDLNAETGVSESRLDLTDLKIESMSLESGVGETRLSMLKPNQTNCRSLRIESGVGALEVTGLGNFGFEDFEFRGGVGATELDFSGDWHRMGEVNIEVGVGGVEIRLPRDIGAEVRVSKSFLSAVDMPGFEQRGSTYYSNNMDRTSKVIKIRVSAGIGGVEFDWM